MSTKLAAAAALLAACALPALAYAADPTPIDPARLSAHVKVLASDEFEGRGPATAGEEKTIAYVSQQMASFGLQPGGDKKADGTRAWTQDVPLARFQIKGPVKVELTMGGKTQALTPAKEISFMTNRPVDRVTIEKAPLVFVGYGVDAPERKWDDFKGVDLKGKIAVVLVNDPDFEADLGGLFNGKAMTYYGRWTYKYEELARRGAAGVLIVHETKPAAYGWNVVQGKTEDAHFDIVQDDPNKAHTALEGWLHRDTAVALFKSAGLDFEAEKKKAQTRAFKPVALKGAAFTADYAVDHSVITSHNIVGILPGAQRPDEVLMFSAHWDHLGVGLPDARGDKIYNGALDNASGTSDLLELARVFAAGPRPQRSLVFNIVTAEEQGLLGSTYYATHPLYDPAKTVGVLNIDMLSAAGPAKDISAEGGGQVSLEDDIAAAAKGHDRYFHTEPDVHGSFFRSDHFSFAKFSGIPALSVSSGHDLVNGGTAAGDAWSREFGEKHYHQPSDEWSPTMDFTGQAQDVGLVYEVAKDLANSNRWPEWKAGSEFKAKRDETAAARK